MNITPSQLLARMIKAAAQMREDSFDQKMADKIQAGVLSGSFDQCYVLGIDQAAAAVCAKEGHHDLTLPVAYLLQSRWNEALAWAEEIKA